MGVINLKELNKVVPYARFKNKDLFRLIEMLLPGNFMSEIGLKDAYFAVSLSKNSQKYVRF